MDAPAYVGLGGNLGDVRSRIEAAVERLAALAGVAAVRRSSLWRTAAVGPVAGQPDYLNAVAELRLGRAAGGAPRLTPRELLVGLLAIERRLGRDRGAEVRFGPRPVDLDLLLCGDLEIDDPGPPALILPHPRLWQRAFALAPLVELAGPELVVPGRGRAGDLLAAALADPAQRVRRCR